MFNILDCTLRDGNHAIDLNFNKEHTKQITKRLIDSGVKYIEIGHPMGPGSLRKDLKLAAATDIEYLESVKELASKANIGTFFLPTIGETSDIDNLCRYNMNFIRIGSNVGSVDKAKSFIKYSKDVGLKVHFSLMKAYAMSPYELSQEAKKLEDFGVDVVHIMDSAGALIPNDVKKYISELKNAVTVKIGFHAHDNLRLAIANALVAIEEGADFIDASLRGLGRSAGNAQLEILVAVLKKSGYDIPINLRFLLDCGTELVKPLIKKYSGLEMLDIIYGYTGFHSNFLPLFEQVSKNAKVDLIDLIILVCDNEKINPTLEMIQDIAISMK
jgi:4-hydroxy-2-oxovalerate aldolase